MSCPSLFETYFNAAAVCIESFNIRDCLHNWLQSIQATLRQA